MIWNGAHVEARLPVRDLERARAWYRDKLGLEAAEEREGGLRYVFGATEFALFTSAGAASGTHTQMGFYVDDIEAAVAELRGRGVDFERVRRRHDRRSRATTPARAAASARRGFATSTATWSGWPRCWPEGCGCGRRRSGGPARPGSRSPGGWRRARS